MKKETLDRLYQEAEPEKIYWWEAIKNCRWQDIDKVLEARKQDTKPKSQNNKTYE